MRFCRYFYVAGEEAGSNTAEDTVKDDDDLPSDHTHRNYDEAVDELTCGTHFLASAAHVPGCKRRHPARLGVARIPYIEPIGESRENFYEAKLVLSLPWFCPELPAETENGEVVWTFRCRLPELGQHVEIDDLKIGKHPPSFEMLCNRFEKLFCEQELDLVCRCCAGELPGAACKTCRRATGFHLCSEQGEQHKWRKGTLFAGPLDVQRALFNLHRSGEGTNVIRNYSASVRDV